MSGREVFVVFALGIEAALVFSGEHALLWLAIFFPGVLIARVLGGLKDAPVRRPGRHDACPARSCVPPRGAYPTRPTAQGPGRLPR